MEKSFGGKYPIKVLHFRDTAVVAVQFGRGGGITSNEPLDSAISTVIEGLLRFILRFWSCSCLSVSAGDVVSYHQQMERGDGLDREREREDGIDLLSDCPKELRLGSPVRPHRVHLTCAALFRLHSV